MSGGKITRIAGGSFIQECETLTFYQDNFTINAGGKISLTCDGEMTFGEPDPIPARELRAQVAVHFRPCKDWRGEYGFDWVRKGDLEHIQGKSVFGDMDYRRLITKQYIKGTQTLETEPNTYTGDFEKDASSYNAMRNAQHIYGIPWREMKDDMHQPVLLPSGGTQNEDYFVPWLSLFPGATAKLSLLMDVEEAATKLIFEYNKEYFKITPDEIDSKSYNKQQFPHALPDVISIECLKEFSQDQRIEVYANDKKFRQNLVGELRVWANDESKRKKLKVVFVEVELPPISEDRSINVKYIEKQEGHLKKSFGQALIETEVLDTIKLDLKNDPYLRNGGTGVKDGMLRDVFLIENIGTTYIINYLKEKLDEKHKEVDKEAFVIFYMAEQGGQILNYGEVSPSQVNLKKIDGIANEGLKYVALFRANGLANSTTAHELFHALGLAHSFTNKEADPNALYTFKAQSTDNIMDYSLWECYSLWKWQWEIINKNI